ncbi:SOS response-associated peptidase [Sanguibacter antarcticus]|uniref:Abasic site processing protein n=1 Tax=Sanguibacter antarcticus TaxID=372484 RepID=A0A2A9E418_9MICO|nr:SOS response-associated peptidase [Sanguibacter antarcticus]PFG33698.1 putative SOS response-associated peptidase YedK [Sanguibacter antarcticus]
MCGRYASFRQAQDLADAFAVRGGIQDVLAVFDDEVAAVPASWNVAPTDPVRIVVERAAPEGAPVRSLKVARWGLVPSWSTDARGGARMINARSESLLEKPAFRRAAASRRCIVPADGYFEWRRPDPAAPRLKRPCYVHPTDGGVLALAGLYEFWRDRSRADDDPARWLVTTTIITAPASGALAELHDRRPVALDRGVRDGWLDPAVGAEEAVALLDTPAPDQSFYEVATTVNRVGTQGPGLLDPLPS